MKHEIEFICDLPVKQTGATQKLWEVEPPVDLDGKKVECFVSSAVVATFSGPETYLFRSDAHGEVIDWAELPGSFRGALDHEAAVKGFEAEINVQS